MSSPTPSASPDSPTSPTSSSSLSPSLDLLLTSLSPSPEPAIPHASQAEAKPAPWDASLRNLNPTSFRDKLLGSVHGHPSADTPLSSGKGGGPSHNRGERYQQLMAERRIEKKAKRKAVELARRQLEAEEGAKNSMSAGGSEGGGGNGSA